MSSSDKTKQYSYLWPALAAAIIGSFTGLISFRVLHHYLVSPNHIVSSQLYLLIGGWTGAMLYPFWASFFGRKLQSDFEGLVWLPPRKQLYPLISGVFGALAVAAELRAISEYDPTLLIPLMQLIVIYMAVYDVFQKEVQLRKIVLPVVLVFVGSILTSLRNLELSLTSLTFHAVLLVAVLRCGFYTVGNIFQNKAVRKDKGDSQLIDRVNFAVYRFFWFAIGTTIINLTTLTLFQQASQLMLIAASGSLALVFVIAAIHMSFGFIQNVLENQANEYGAISKVGIIFAFRLPGAVILTLIANLLSPGYLGNPPDQTVLWSLRLPGMILILLGIIFLRLGETTQPTFGDINLLTKELTARVLPKIKT